MDAVHQRLAERFRSFRGGCKVGARVDVFGDFEHLAQSRVQRVRADGACRHGLSLGTPPLRRYRDARRHQARAATGVYI